MSLFGAVRKQNPRDSKQEIQVDIYGLRASLVDDQRVVILMTEDNQMYLPIWIGPVEAENIAIPLQRSIPSQPFTHDFLFTILEAAEAILHSVVIHGIDEDTLYAAARLLINGECKTIQCRPSDAMAIALTANAPIFVTAELMDKVGRPMTEDVQINTDTTAAPFQQKCNEHPT